MPDIQAEPTPTEYALREKGILLCYNQFAPQYASFQEMIGELPKIASLGYNAVWVSPLHPVSQHPKYNGRKGSLYAPVDLNRWRGDFFGTEDVNEQKKLLQEYTAQARKFGMKPMFDLVLNHMGRTSEEAPNEIECGTNEKLNETIRQAKDEKAISTRNWFRREYDKEGHPLIIDGVDTDKPDFVQVGNRRMDMWDDIAMFDYSTPEKRRQIFEYLWKPHIDLYIRELGFEGMRVDAAQKVQPPEILHDVLGYAAKACNETHHAPPVILAEALGEVTEAQRQGLQNCHITHIINGSFWAPLKHAPENWSKGEREFEGDWKSCAAGMDKTRYDLRWVVRYNPEGGPPNLHPNARGGDVSLQESHDHHSHANTWQYNNDIDREQGLREAMAVGAFYAGAGSVACTGMHEADDRKRSVFINENQLRDKSASPRIDMSDFLRELHIIQAKQPALDIGAWTERKFLPGRPELLVMVTHDYENSDEGRQEKTYLKMANTRPHYTVSLRADEISTLAGWSGKTEADFSAARRESRGIYLCGGITADIPLPGVNGVHVDALAAEKAVA